MRICEIEIVIEIYVSFKNVFFFMDLKTNDNLINRIKKHKRIKIKTTIKKLFNKKIKK